MRTYIASPDTTRDTDSDIPLFVVDVATNVCSTEAYTIRIPAKDNRYITLMSLALSDDECDVLIEKLAEARAERLFQQERAYEQLHAKFAGPFDNTTANDGWTDEGE
jgi:hypothetical protein